MADVDRWCEALLARHTAALSTPEFLKAVRALSARYVEARGRLPERSPLDSAGKRAAFAAFYAPMHFLVTQEIVRRVELTSGIDTIVDLGCGSGVAGAAWALECGSSRPSVRGIDRNTWALAEAAWNFRELGVRGTTERGDLVSVAGQTFRSAEGGRPKGLPRPSSTGVILGWSVNELTEDARGRLHAALTDVARAGATVLVIEPIARSATPWWASWISASERSNAKVRTDDWKFDLALPPTLARLRESAGFSERPLSARTMLVTGGTGGSLSRV